MLSHPKSLDDAIRSGADRRKGAKEKTNTLTAKAPTPQPRDNAKRVAAALEANTAAIKEVLGAIQDLKVRSNLEACLEEGLRLGGVE